MREKFTSDIIADHKQTISRLQRECTEKTDLIIKLGEALEECKRNKRDSCNKLRSECLRLIEENTELKKKLKTYNIYKRILKPKGL